MAKHVLALQPQLAEAPGEQEEHLAAYQNNWNQEQEVHARGRYENPESYQEQLQRLLPGMDLKRLVL